MNIIDADAALLQMDAMIVKGAVEDAIEGMGYGAVCTRVGTEANNPCILVFIQGFRGYRCAGDSPEWTALRTACDEVETPCHFPQ